MTPTQTTCPVCGADVNRVGDTLYRLDINGALHGCTAPAHDIPPPDGLPMVFDDAVGELVSMSGAS